MKIGTPSLALRARLEWSGPEASARGLTIARKPVLRDYPQTPASVRGDHYFAGINRTSTTPWRGTLAVNFSVPVVMSF